MHIRMDPPNNRALVMARLSTQVLGCDLTTGALTVHSRVPDVGGGVGLDSVDIAAATAHNIIVCNTPGMVSSSVADMTFALMLSLARDLRAATRRGANAEWVQVQAADVFGATLGIPESERPMFTMR